MSNNYPQFQVVPYVFSFGTSTSSGFLALSLAGAGASWQPNSGIIGSMQHFNQQTGGTSTLNASQNLAGYPMAYISGNGSNNTWNGSAAAQAAAQADYVSLTTARDAAAAQGALNATLPNQYVSLGTAISGPG